MRTKSQPGWLNLPHLPVLPPPVTAKQMMVIVDDPSVTIRYICKASKVIIRNVKISQKSCKTEGNIKFLLYAVLCDDQCEEGIDGYGKRRVLGK